MSDPGDELQTHRGHPAVLSPAAVSRRLPGKARPREDVLREYQDLNAKRRDSIPRALWPFLAPDPEQWYCWRVQLDCGCITEALTWDDKSLPSERQWLDRVNRAWLPQGQFLCQHNDSPPAPYRAITEWKERREVSFPADPVDPPDQLDPRVWAIIRHDEPHTSAFWTVTLACGHVTESPTDLHWNSADGPSRVSATRQQEMTAEFEEFCVSDPDAQDEHERDHMRRMLAAGWPRPAPEHKCYTCPWARFIVAYEPTGWLVPPKPEPEPPNPPSRASLERRLRQAEKESEQLRSQLAQLDGQKENDEQPQ